MATIGQAQFTDSGDVIILCDSKWTCCQREQAKAKVTGYQKECPMKIKKKVSKTQKRAKERCQSRQTSAMDREMKLDQDAAADKFSASPCLASQLKKTGASRSGMNLEMDHPREVKWSGPANTKLKALDDEINGFMGGVTKNIGDKMLKKTPPQDTVQSVSLICKPPCKPPLAKDKDTSYSTGPKRSYPKNTDPSRMTPEHAL